ncbi:hypothetical protein Plut_1832 [Pelodictyon luteolum DSM 273]|uniref:Uncharacterized protein n=1 Tax=Chlorobium luteolum (strain DSM 273 / BCRC 81028 / 2530) TaxID=319225 RepID=Q3B1U6_CHLL3|nr:hypothetical protein Plut_1832 [Pelodictyon luteolum DSM 273]
MPPFLITVEYTDDIGDTQKVLRPTPNTIEAPVTFLSALSPFATAYFRQQFSTPYSSSRHEESLRLPLQLRLMWFSKELAVATMHSLKKIWWYYQWNRSAVFSMRPFRLFSPSLFSCASIPDNMNPQKHITPSSIIHHFYFTSKKTAPASHRRPSYTQPSALVSTRWRNLTKPAPAQGFIFRHIPTKTTIFEGPQAVGSTPAPLDCHEATAETLRNPT